MVTHQLKSRSASLLAFLSPSSRFVSQAGGLTQIINPSTPQIKADKLLGPPAWKQNLAIVVGLYPMVMVQTFLFTTLHLMHSWSHASSMLVNNLISSSILTWLVMPLVTKGLSFWLTPDRHSSLKLNVLGTGVVAIVLLGMLSLFNYLEL